MHVTITPKAEKFIRRMVSFGGGEAGSGFRLALQAGGCSGLSYTFTVESSPQPDDVVIEGNGIRVFVPSECRAYLDGVVVDCEDTLMHTGLTFFNPNAGASCGCGTSFEPKS